LIQENIGIDLILFRMVTFKFKNSKVFVSSSIKNLLNKKANIYFQERSKNTQSLRFTTLNHNDLKYIKVSFFKKIKTIIIAFSLLFLYFTKMFVVISKNNKSKNKTVFVFSLTKDQIFRDSSLYEFHNFLHSKKINMTKKNEILIECRGVLRTKRYSNLIVTLDIPLNIFTVKFSLQKKIMLLSMFSRRLLTLIKSFNNSQFMYLVYKQYIFDESVYLLFLSENQVNKVITGPGNYKYQPIIFEMSEYTGERIMIWYSSNSVPNKYKSKLENVDRNYKLTEGFLKQMKIDTHWVWTNQHKKYLRKLTDSNIFVKQSMVFYNCPKKINYSKKYDIVIFDVTPKNSKSEFSNTIYAFPPAKEFIDEIIESVMLVSQKLGKDISICIKYKRTFSKDHSSRYITYIDNLAKNGKLFVLPLNIDLYKTIAESKVIIGYPFTSPVVIGQELSVPSIYYSSSNLLSKYNKNDFIQDKFKLRKFIEKNLGE